MQKRVGKWVSHNKVLVGSGDNSKKHHARNPNFDSEETKLLIQLWGDPQVQKTLVTIHKKHPVISKIADKMRLHGYNRTTEEINTRIKNLKCLYNRIKKDLDSGLLNEPSWKHYNAMHEIISRPIFGNSSQMPPNQKIVISPSIVSNINECSIDFHHNNSLRIKEEDDENDSMDFEEQELRPEDLLTVEEERIDNIPIKTEPFDDEDDVINQQDVNKSNLNISTCTNEKLVVKETEMNATSVQQISSFHQNATNNAGNKISIVPTKLLLKPPTTTTILPKPSVTSQQSHVPSMKLLFVNTNSNAQNKTTPTTTSMGRSKFFHHDQKMNLIRTTLCAPSIESRSKSGKKIEEKLEDDEEKSGDKKDVKFPTIKNILNNIHKELKMKNKIETERNEIERQRFELEKNRLEYEKSIGCEILSFLSNFTKSNENANK